MAMPVGEDEIIDENGPSPDSYCGNLSGIHEFPDETEDQFAGTSHSKNTKAVVATSVKVLSDYCTKSANTTLAAVEQMAPGELCQFLRDFYSNVRQKDGSFYARRSMATVRYGLQRHFLKVMKVDINSGSEFRSANATFMSVLRNLKTSVKMSHVRKKNMAKIRSSPATDCSTPKGLQNTVFIDLMMQLCFSTYGRHNLRGMTKSHFKILLDPSTTLRYVCFDPGYDDDEIDRDSPQCPHQNDKRMYETPGKPQSCPVSNFTKYVARLHPHCEFFWQRPKKMCMNMSCDPVWFDAFPLGKNTLGNKMREISAEAGCSTMYSNQCLRRTSKRRRNSGCRERRSTWYGDITSSSEQDDESSEYDDQMQDSIGMQHNFQDHDHHPILEGLGSNCPDMEPPITVKTEMDPFNQGPPMWEHTAQNTLQQIGISPSALMENYQHSYHPTFGSTAGEHLVNRRQTTVSTVPNHDSWTIEKSWIDGNNQRKCLLTQSGSSIPVTTTTSGFERNIVRSPINCVQGYTSTSNQGQRPMSHQGVTDSVNGIPSDVNRSSGTVRAMHLSSGSSTAHNAVFGGSGGINSSRSGINGSESGISGINSIPGTSTNASMPNAGDDQLLQLQKNVLRMQQENLALEQQKIKLEMAKLEAERLKLEAERRKFTMEGDKLQREMLS